MKLLASTTIQLVGIFAVAIGAIPVTSYAQGDYLEEIIVTARQREERLQDVPADVHPWRAEEDAFAVVHLLPRPQRHPATDACVHGPRGVHGVRAQAEAARGSAEGR